MTPIDPTVFDSWTAVAALAVMVAGGVALRWIAVIKADTTRTREQVDATSAKVAQVTRTLTENNSGSHVKDQLDRIETKLNGHLTWSDNYVKEQDERLAAMERRGWRRWFGR